ncbi:hypothetical protein BGX26_001462 [Mortierella sp. AD094]|nr:hypothetical protein BGX26_001462 [Mortierella sp. AD094]
MTIKIEGRASNDKELYDPIMSIISSMRARSVELKNFENFFEHVSRSTLKEAPLLRNLSIGTGFSAINWPSNRLSPSTKESTTFRCILKDLTGFASSLHMDINPILKAEISTNTLNTPPTHHLTALTIRPTSISQEVKDSLDTIIRRNPQLSQIQIQCHTTQAMELFEKIEKDYKQSREMRLNNSAAMRENPRVLV